MIHKAVLLDEVIDSLNLKPSLTVVDATLGAGGHSKEILRNISPGGKLIAIDWDEQAIRNFKRRINQENFVREKKSETVLVRDNFANIEKILEKLGEKNADAIFADLGFSSDQIKDSPRGFSFLRNGFLDMRYSSQTQTTTAASVVNSFSERKLAEIFFRYGEEKNSKRIAQKIVQERKFRPIETTRQLVEVIAKAVPQRRKSQKIHFATKIFQALRIEVNQELSNLKMFLEGSVRVLASGGRLAVISFHSLEDRIVKNFFRKESQDCVCPSNSFRCSCRHHKTLRLITKKPIIPTADEIKRNPRARSAKLRIAERI